MTTLDQEKFNTAKELAVISGNLSDAILHGIITHVFILLSPKFQTLF